MSKGLNLQSVKSKNRSMVLYLLNEYKQLSRKDIASKLSLTPAGVTKISAELIDEGFVKEIGESGSGVGRREIMLALQLDDKFVLGVNAEKNSITYSLSNLNGELIVSKVLSYCPNVDEAVSLAQDFLHECEEYRKNIIGVGVCTVGTARDDGYAVWKTKNLTAKFENALGLPVVVENNVKAFAESELIYGKVKDTNAVLFFKWGPGVGSSIVTNGKVFSGNDSGVTEIGHYIVNANGKKCRCGRCGCLETEVGEDALLETARKRNANVTRDDIAMCNLDVVQSVIDEKTDFVAMALTNTATILGSYHIVLFGAMFTNPKIAEKLKLSCEKFCGDCVAPTLSISKLNDKRGYIGATAIGAKTWFFER